MIGRFAQGMKGLPVSPRKSGWSVKNVAKGIGHVVVGTASATAALMSGGALAAVLGGAAKLGLAPSRPAAPPAGSGAAPVSAHTQEASAMGLLGDGGGGWLDTLTNPQVLGTIGNVFGIRELSAFNATAGPTTPDGTPVEPAMGKVGTAVGAVGAGVLSAGRAASLLVGRIVAKVGAHLGVRLRPSKIASMVRKVGPEAAAAALGITVGEALFIESHGRRRRGRGISPRDIRMVRKAQRTVKRAQRLAAAFGRKRCR